MKIIADTVVFKIDEIVDAHVQLILTAWESPAKEVFRMLSFVTCIVASLGWHYHDVSIIF